MNKSVVAADAATVVTVGGMLASAANNNLGLALGFGVAAVYAVAADYGLRLKAMKDVHRKDLVGPKAIEELHRN